MMTSLNEEPEPVTEDDSLAVTVAVSMEGRPEAEARMLQALTVLRGATPTTSQEEMRPQIAHLKTLYEVFREEAKPALVAVFVQKGGPAVLKHYLNTINATMDEFTKKIPSNCGYGARPEHVVAFYHLMATVCSIVECDAACVPAIMDSGLLTGALHFHAVHPTSSCSEHGLDPHESMSGYCTLKFIQQMSHGKVTVWPDDTRQAGTEFLRSMGNCSRGFAFDAYIMLIGSGLAELFKTAQDCKYITMVLRSLEQCLSMAGGKGPKFEERERSLDGIAVVYRSFDLDELTNCVMELNRRGRFDHKWVRLEKDRQKWDLADEMELDDKGRLMLQSIQERLLKQDLEQRVKLNAGLERCMKAIVRHRDLVPDIAVNALEIVQEMCRHETTLPSAFREGRGEWLDLLYDCHQSEEDGIRDAADSLFRKLCAVATGMEEKCNHVLHAGVWAQAEEGKWPSPCHCGPLLLIFGVVSKVCSSSAGSLHKVQYLLSMLPTSVKRAFGRQTFHSGYEVTLHSGKEVTLLHSAVLKGDLPLVEFLMEQCEPWLEQMMERECSPATRPIQFMTPLYLAVRLDKPNIAQFLLQHGACANTSSGLYTALQLACKRGSEELARLLVCRGADANATNYAGRTALMYSSSLSINEFLLSRDADVNAVARNGDTALSVAVAQDKVDLVVWLLEHGASKEVCVEGADLLAVGILSGSSTVVAHLLSTLDIGPEQRAVYDELCATKLYIEDFQQEEAVEKWGSALCRRQECGVPRVLDASAVEYGLTVAVNSVKDLERMRSTGDLDRYALWLREQILGPGHPLTASTFRGNLLFNGGSGLENYVSIGSRLAMASRAHAARVDCSRPQKDKYSPCTVMIDSLLREFHHHWLMQPGVNFSSDALKQVLGIFVLAVDNAREVAAVRRQRPVCDAHSLEMEHRMQQLLRLVTVFCLLAPLCDQAGKAQLSAAVRQMVQLQLRVPLTGQSLLHLATWHIVGPQNMKWNGSVVEMLLQCGANVDDVDDAKDTPAHALHSRYTTTLQQQGLSATRKYPGGVAAALANHGAHLDARNSRGTCAWKALRDCGHRVDRGFPTLQCLTARVVMTHRIPYQHLHLPEQFAQLVALH